MLLIGARITETTAATWSQIDLEAKTWTIPPEHLKDTRTLQARRHKQKPALVIPLSRQAVRLLIDAREAEVVRRQLNGIMETVLEHDLLLVGPRGAKLGNWDRWLKEKTDQKISHQGIMNIWEAQPCTVSVEPSEPIKRANHRNY